MNILCDELPKSINIDGAEYEINTDFRVWIRIDLLLSANKADEIDRLYALTKAVMLCYKVLPPNIQRAVEGMAEFYRGTQKQCGGTGGKKAIYSFEHDSEYILSSFMYDYNIDLTAVNMHWYKFKALFSSLSDDTMFVKIMQYRSVDLGKIKDKEQKRFYRRMKRVYALPDGRTEEEKERDMAQMLSGMM